MNSLVISDIHANFFALKALQKEIEKADEVFLLGDVVGYYAQPNEVINYLKEFQHIKVILGNHDYWVSNKYPATLPKDVIFGIEYAREHLSEENKQWINNLPIHSGYLKNGKLISLYHGSPWDSLGDYMYENTINIKELDRFSFSYLFFGQTHRPYYHKITNGKIVINPGSVGQSRNKKNIVQAYLIKGDFGAGEFIEKSYDVERFIDFNLKCGVSKSILEKHH